MKNVLVYTQHIQKEIANIRSFLPQGRVSFDDEMTRDAVAYGIIRIARQIDGLVRALAQNEAEIRPAYLQTLAGQLETRLIDADFDKVWHNVDVELPAIATEIQRLTAIFEANPGASIDASLPRFPPPHWQRLESNGMQYWRLLPVSM